MEHVAIDPDQRELQQQTLLDVITLVSPKGLETALQPQPVPPTNHLRIDVLEVPDRPPLSASGDVGPVFPDVSGVHTQLGRVAVGALETDRAQHRSLGDQVPLECLASRPLGQVVQLGIVLSQGRSAGRGRHLRGVLARSDSNRHAPVQVHVFDQGLLAIHLQ